MSSFEVRAFLVEAGAVKDLRFVVESQSPNIIAEEASKICPWRIESTIKKPSQQNV